MPSHYNLATGAFAGNCAPNSPPPEGYGYVADAPPVGMGLPQWNGTSWESAPEWNPPTAPVATDWDALNLAIMSDAAFNQVYGAVMQSHPLIAAALPAALTQVATGQTAMFATAFSQMCAVADVAPFQRESWAQIAETHHAPPEFVKIVRGVINGK